VSVLVFAHGGIALDASCGINLYASGKLGDILAALPTTASIAEYVYVNEMLKISQGPGRPDVKIDLEQVISCGALQVVPLEPGDEEITALNFAAFGLDNGEAITSALAFHRSWAIALDDRSATSLLKREAAHLQLITTPELIKYWVDSSAPQTELVREVLQNIEKLGRYGPPRDHPLITWWHSFK
jgi:hypothetical protein